jgi:hypothetical protein
VVCSLLSCDVEVRGGLFTIASSGIGVVLWVVAACWGEWSTWGGREVRALVVGRVDLRRVCVCRCGSRCSS